ncbi:hypothetical protein [Streptomyces mangrovisoli]|uniref:hypothetical protein n=1 Tax=Streptomyces mangrovisoli TaxID=1428628 RepID=UPI001160B9B1|nr:hypothetical protein [Streptomyces mangrovisoli]
MNGEVSRSFDFARTASRVVPEISDPQIMTFARDHLMEESWEKDGHSLDSAGEGPVGVFCRPFRKVTIRVDAGVDISGGVSWEGGIIAVPEGFYVSLVAPENPSDDEFSDWVKSCLLRSIRE